jgi:hypothetical protein
VISANVNTIWTFGASGFHSAIENPSPSATEYCVDGSTTDIGFQE